MSDFMGLVTLKSHDLLASVLENGVNLEISLEGHNLNQFRLSRFGVITSTTPTESLPRNTQSPPLDFLIMEVNDELKSGLIEEIKSYPARIRDLVHIQINSQGQRIFEAIDNFDKVGVYIQISFGENIISTLIEEGVVGEVFSPPNYPD